MTSFVKYIVYFFVVYLCLSPVALIAWGIHYGITGGPTVAEPEALGGALFASWVMGLLLVGACHDIMGDDL